MTTTLPKTMRALIQPSPKSTDLTLITRPLPTPTPNTTEHLIKVHAVSPCSGELLWPLNFPPPTTREFIPCYDVSGSVVTAPTNSPFKTGDEVYFRSNYLRNGCASDYTIGVTEELALRPKGLSTVEATAIPLSAQTAWQALFIHTGIGDIESGNWKGKRVFVTAASGGVGMWVVQLAKIAGATVVGTCGPDNIELVKSLGADEVLNYRSMDVKAWSEDAANKVDVVIDCIGRRSLADAWWTVKEGGIMLSIFQPPDMAKPEELAVNVVKDIFFVMEPKREHLEPITRLVEEGMARGVVDSVWPLEQFAEAFKRVEGGHAKGKVIIDLALNQ
ncbi:NAD(P)-binding protein [Aspergillus karnatakaensis]|uniref:NADP-dependent oxidoreductase n=1 Tax=Aspergillus karnatakaensis TaxID=1810916 RepID=UPI003CCDE2BF